MSTRFSPTNLLIAVLGAAVIGLGIVVAVDHTAGAPRAQSPAAATSTLGVSPALRNVIGTAMTAGSTTGKGGAYGQAIAGLFGLTPDQLKADIDAGQTLDQIAGAKDQTIKDEVLGYVSMALDKGVTGGAISSTQESSIKSDLTDLIDQLFAANLGNLKNLKAGG
ncbi:MAG: hypothetical protein JOZ75_06030 [Candidatus Dormibacteraeota bacterium]|nr:hypothetical protein [Candidatus Dormibacteraeota bacterium]